jgi:hypothetical protein
LSTTEAEHLALTETIRELKWVKGLLRELDVSIDGMKPTTIYVDNQSTIKLVQNHTNHRRSKHVALRNHYCREQFNRGKIDLQYIDTSKQRADKLTKARSDVQLY